MKKFIIAAILSLSAFSAFAEIATVTWVAPTQRVDGTPLTLEELREFRIYWGLGTNFNNMSVVSDATLTTYVIDGLDIPGTYSFRMTAVDTEGRESGYSMVATKTVVSTSPPLPPTITSVE
jgi:hypothetical protein